LPHHCPLSSHDSATSHLYTPSLHDALPISPATSIDTSSSQGAPPVAVRVITACAGTWMESMVTNSDGGQRIVVYEEGWDNISSEDRKSTRLNSSHVSISYAVFCLKKQRSIE